MLRLHLLAALLGAAFSVLFLNGYWKTTPPERGRLAAGRRRLSCKWQNYRHKIVCDQDKNAQRQSGKSQSSSPKAKAFSSAPRRSSPPTPHEKNTTMLSFWLHIPKCGTSFGTSVAIYGIHNSQDISKNHQALSTTFDRRQLLVVVAMFRDPDQRLLSAYNWIKRTSGCCTVDWGWEPPVFRPVLEAIRHHNISPGDAIARFTGCQTNMILGRGCMTQGNISTEQVADAKRRISLFRFVGLQEQWTMSICLFNYIMTGRRFFAKDELEFKEPGLRLKNFEKDKEAHVLIKPIGAYDASLLGPRHLDVADTAIYLFAKERFVRECEAYNITKASCYLEPLPKPN